jgi:hypothetical protein
MVQRGRLREGLDSAEPVTQSMRGRPKRWLALQPLNSIEAVGDDRGFWLMNLPPHLVAAVFQLRRANPGSLVEVGLGRRAKILMKDEGKVAKKDC